jgi:hypothetical protein
MEVASMNLGESIRTAAADMASESSFRTLDDRIPKNEHDVHEGERKLYRQSRSRVKQIVEKNRAR